MQRTLQLLVGLALLPLFFFCYGNAAGSHGPLHCWKLQDNTATLATAIVVIALAIVSVVLPRSALVGRAIPKVQLALVMMLIILCFRIIGYGETGHEWSVSNLANVQKYVVLLLVSFTCSLLAVSSGG